MAAFAHQVALLMRNVLVACCRVSGVPWPEPFFGYEQARSPLGMSTLAGDLDSPYFSLQFRTTINRLVGMCFQGQRAHCDFVTADEMT